MHAPAHGATYSILRLCLNCAGRKVVRGWPKRRFPVAKENSPNHSLCTKDRASAHGTKESLSLTDVQEQKRGWGPTKKKKLGHHARTRKAPYISITYNLRAFPAFESCVRVESNEVEYTKSTKTTKVQQFRYISPLRLKRALCFARDKDVNTDERHNVEPCAGGLQGKRMKIGTYEF